MLFGTSSFGRASPDNYEESFISLNNHLEFGVVVGFVDVDDLVSVPNLIFWEGLRASPAPPCYLRFTLYSDDVGARLCGYQRNPCFGFVLSNVNMEVPVGAFLKCHPGFFVVRVMRLQGCRCVFRGLDLLVLPYPAVDGEGGALVVVAG